MSRAPAPMKTNTATPETTTNTTPYNMQTYSMMPNVTNNTMDSPLNTMQSMYGNLQLQQHQQQQQIHQQQQLQQQQQMQQQYMTSSMHPHMNPEAHSANTTKNVAVVDFKPDIMAQQHLAHMQQKYNQQLSAMNTSQSNSIGLIGRDGQYIPATAATPYNQHSATASCVNHGVEPYSYRQTGQSALPYHSQAASTSHPYNEPTPHRNSVDRVNMQKNNRNSMSGITNLIDERIVTAAAANDAAKAATGVSERALDALIEKRYRAHETKSTAIKNIVEDHLRNTVPQTAAVANSFHTKPQTAAVANSFHTKPKHVQREIISKAVESAVSDFRMMKKPSTASSSYDDGDYNRYTSDHPSSYHDRKTYGRYSRRDSF